MSTDAKALHWRINCFCNRRCPFCYGPQKLHEAKLDESLPVLDRMIEYGISTFILTGGEPLLSKKLDQIVQYISARSARVIIYSNCDYFDFHEDVLADCLDTLCVPIDGASEYTHDSVRGANNYRAVMSVLDRYATSSSPFKVKVGTVLGRHNIEELRAIMYTLDKYRIDKWKIYEYLRYEDRDLQKKWSGSQLGITESEYRSATRSLMDLQDRKTEVVVSSQYDRANSYFMMNPDLEIILPTRGDDGSFFDLPLCDAQITPVEEIEALWSSKVDWSTYEANIGLTFG